MEYLLFASNDDYKPGIWLIFERDVANNNVLYRTLILNYRKELNEIPSFFHERNIEILRIPYRKFDC